MTVPGVRWVVSGLVLFVAFAVLGVLVARQPPALDLAVADSLRGQENRPLGHVAGALTNVLGPVLPYLLGAVLVVVALRRRDHTGLCVRLGVVLVVCRLTSVLGKLVFERQRPRVYPETSYPSGHVVSVASTAFVAVLLCVWLAPRLVRWAVGAAVAATVLGAACRIVLGVHWVTDTVGAVLAVTGVGLVTAAAAGLLPPPPGGRNLAE
ncbi:phosphatase PAP2 family protein [Amycolatopsis samaneae]|uniref:Phosphatase PAP2 family protein n=1 Tax=Amycolatopsis samaneae TaxID=664691 RepID=A0ABW5GY36_9PSEU